MNYKALLAIATIQLAINLTPLLSIAAKGGVGDGGANSHNGQLLDSYIAENSQRLSFEEVLEQNPLVKKFIDHASSKLVGFKKNINTDKSWLFINGTISEKDFPECVNSSAVKANKKIVACQWSQSFIIIDKKWFDSKSESTKASLIMHEAYVGLAQRNGLYDDVETKRIIELEIQLFNGNVFKNNTKNFDLSFSDLFRFMVLLGLKNVASVDFLKKIKLERSKFISAVTRVCGEDIDQLNTTTAKALIRYSDQINDTPIPNLEAELDQSVLTKYESNVLYDSIIHMQRAKLNMALAIDDITSTLTVGSYFAAAVFELKSACYKSQYKDIRLDEDINF